MRQRSQHVWALRNGSAHYFKKKNLLASHPNITKSEYYHFPSTSEFNRWQELLILQQAGEIKDLRVHPVYTLIAGCDDSITWEADFEYIDEGDLIAEDVKAVITRKGKQKHLVQDAAKLKLRIFRITHPDYTLRLYPALWGDSL